MSMMFPTRRHVRFCKMRLMNTLLKKNAEKAEHHRRLTVEGQDRAVRDQLRGSDNVRKVVELEQAWKAKEHSRVIQIARELIPTSPPPQQFVAYQYIYESSKALGDDAGAQRALAEAQRLKGSLR